MGEEWDKWVTSTAMHALLSWRMIEAAEGTAATSF